MGSLTYPAAGFAAEVDDRVLAHLEIVIFSKLRRNERFMLTLPSEDDGAGQTEVLWLDPAFPLRFTYSASARPAINATWVSSLADEASSRTGLRIIPEPLAATTPAAASRPHPVHWEARPV
jgi:hypothetical protein